MDKEKYIELHAHLDGSITVDIARKLAAIQDIKIDKSDAELLDILSVSEDCKNLTEFLKCFDFPLSLLQTREGITHGVRLVLEDMAAAGVIYAEIRFAPQLHTQKGLTQEEAVEAAVKGLRAAESNDADSAYGRDTSKLYKSDIDARLILCCMRGTGNEAANIETIQLAYAHSKKNDGVVGLDLAGAEGLYPTSDYTGIFKEAGRLGIPFTIHAGEAAGADSVKTAIHMGASRIGHGVRAIEDEKVLELIKKKNICLEMCPTSNRITKACADMAYYPLRRYIDMGIKVTINTDDSAIIRTDIAKEFEYAGQLANIDEKEIRQLKINAIEASFADEAVKERIKCIII